MRPPALFVLAAVIAAGFFFDSAPPRVEAHHLCPNTGSPYGPYPFGTYEAADYKNTYARTFELAGYNHLFNDVASFAMPALEAGERSAGSSSPGPTYIPPVILKAIAWIESSWAQGSYGPPPVPYGGVGPVLASHDCGYGLMQVTSGMQNVTGHPSLDQAMIGGHFGFNVARGARILADKWNAAPEYRPLVGNRDPYFLENWYYALWAYNGFSFKNHPFNPVFDPQRTHYRCDGTQPRSAYPYQELVFGCVANPPWRGGTQLWSPQPVTLPNLVDPTFANSLRLENWDPCSQSLQCAAMDMPTPGPANTDPTSVNFGRSNVFGSPAVATSTSTIQLAAPPGSQSTTVALAIGNSGTGVLAWRLSTNAPWLKLSTVQGVSLGADLGYLHQVLNVWADTSVLLPGVHTAQIGVESLYAAGAPGIVNVTVEAGDGSTVVGPDGRVYLLQGGLRRYIPDPPTFEAESEAPYPIAVPDSWLEATPSGDPVPSVLARGRLIQPEGQPTIFVMDNGGKRHIVSPQVMAQCGWDSDSIDVISVSTANAIPNGPPLIEPSCPRPSFANGTLLASSDGRVWVVQWNSRRWIGGPAAFGSCGYEGGNINVLGDSMVGPLYAGVNLQSCTAEGSLLWNANGSIHVVFGGTKRHIPDPSTFEVGGYDWSGVAPVGATLLPTGHPVMSVLSTGVLLRPPGANSPVYVIEGGAKRHIVSPAVLASCGYNGDAVSAISSGSVDSIPSGQPLQSAPCPKLEPPVGTLLLGPDGTVWATVGQTRKWVAGPNVFAGCGYQGGDLVPALSPILAAMIPGPPITDCTAEGALLVTPSGSVYVVRSNSKRHVPNPATLEAHGLSWASVVPIPQGWMANGSPLLNVIANGRLVREPGVGVAVYAMDGGVKRHIVSPEALEACGYGADAITVLSPPTIAALPMGPALGGPPCPQPSFPSGTLLNTPDGRIWATDDGLRRWISGPATFAACGYRGGDINTVAQGLVNALPEGSSLHAPPCP